jgi:hypothetical protein
MGWLMRTRLTSMCLVALLFALVSISKENMSAQSPSAAPPESQKLSSAAELPASVPAKPPNSPDAAKQFSKALQIAAKRGRPSHVPDYIAGDLGLARASTANPLWASELGIDGARRIYLVNDTDTAVVITAVNEQTMVYLVRSGVLKKAGQLKSGKWGSKSLQNVPLASAVGGFNAERDLWIEQLAAKFPPGPPSKK